MKQTGKWMERFTDEMSRSAQALPGVPLVEILGRNRVLIEHHGGVTRYGADMICVKVSYGHIRIEGCGLELARMSKEQLIICGKIRSVQIMGRDG